jgi:KaiC/GvpD/RAD55 family RecA-like ATPase
MQCPTFLSPVFSRRPPHGRLETLVPLEEEDSTMQVCWLDALMELGSERGLSVPDDLLNRSHERSEQSLLMLLSGPTGSGKSTFALELCCRMVSRSGDGLKPPVSALYISAEESTHRIIDKAARFGWGVELEPKPQAERLNTRRRVVFDYDSPYFKTVPPSSLLVYGRERLRQQSKWKENFQDISTKWQAKCAEYHTTFVDVPQVLQIIVIDSLNVIAPQARSDLKVEVFEAIQTEICSPPKNPALVIVILDAARDDEHSTYWEFVSDIVFRFDRRTVKDYETRTFRILKMREQKHALGLHQLKIYEGPKLDDGGRVILARGDRSPFLKEGGIVVFPSIHWHLSELQRRQTGGLSSPRALKTAALPADVEELNRQLSDKKQFAGLPAPGCTALIGPRGSMKSHLAYLFLLDQAVKRKNCLLVSLRDDVDAAQTTLSQIAENQGMPSPHRLIGSLLKRDRLEIIYNEPGCISPEELFHKIYVAVRRQRGKNVGAAEVVVVNGLDQLNSRYPLIAHEPMFVPALVRLLKEQELCVLIVSATREAFGDEGRSLYGLQSMADLILSFERMNAHEIKELNADTDYSALSASEQIARVESVRVPAGQIGGRIGFLHRIPRSKRVTYAWKHHAD